MRVFLVNKEFAVQLSVTTFQVHKDDLVWADERNGLLYLFKLERKRQKSEREIIHLPINLNSTVFIHRGLSTKKIDTVIEEKYITDITVQYERDKKLKKLL